MHLLSEFGWRKWSSRWVGISRYIQQTVSKLNQSPQYFEGSKSYPILVTSASLYVSMYSAEAMTSREQRKMKLMHKFIWRLRNNWDTSDINSQKSTDVTIYVPEPKTTIKSSLCHTLIPHRSLVKRITKLQAYLSLVLLSFVSRRPGDVPELKKEKLFTMLSAMLPERIATSL